MSIQRYAFVEQHGALYAVREGGDWVKYDDHAKLLSARLQQIEELRDQLTACLLERDRLRVWREKAIDVLPLIPREVCTALALRVSELLRPDPQPCTHDDPSWCDAKCERWREWVKARRSSEPQGGDHGSND